MWKILQCLWKSDCWMSPPRTSRGNLCGENSYSLGEKKAKYLSWGRAGTCNQESSVPVVLHLVVIDWTPREVEAIVPSDRTRLMTSGTREQSVPKWLQQFTDRLAEKAVDSSSSPQGEKVPEAPPSRIPAKIQINKLGAKYYVFNHFPRDPNW